MSPTFYLHSDLQRQLLGLLRNMGPDILVATQPMEIITEAEADDIVLISKRRKMARRIKHPSQLQEVFTALGSNLNPVLTQLAKTRRAVFVEGKDFQIISRFARKLGANKVANRSDFAVIPVDGFNPERVRSLKLGMEATLGGKIGAAVILDRDYRGDEEREAIAQACKQFCDLVQIHSGKEIENFLLNAVAIDRAGAQKVADQAKRSGKDLTYVPEASMILKQFCAERKSCVMAQSLAFRKRFEQKEKPGLADATINELALKEFDAAWESDALRLMMIPGKEALATINQRFQEVYDVSVTPTAIIDSMHVPEVPPDMAQLVERLTEFAAAAAP